MFNVSSSKKKGVKCVLSNAINGISSQGERNKRHSILNMGLSLRMSIQRNIMKKKRTELFIDELIRKERS